MDTGVWKVARRPRWIAALLLALAIAGTLAWLGQWQLERSFRATDAPTIDTETAVPLTELTEPQTSVTENEAGRVVTVSGTLRAEEPVLLTGRSGGGAQSVWLVGRLDTENGATLPVALGWAESEDAALAAAPTAEQPAEFTGRYLPGEGPQESDFEAGERTALAPAELVNLWDDVDAIYGGYLLLHDEWPGLGRIDSPEPEPPVAVNWLNLFYAIEWAVFALFALFIWYRLVADEREQEAEQDRDQSPQAAAVD
ncbi:SURF1 family protein [Lysobacter korlensis]|uniref:SURF1-like protein n=1 Tax=Lysobacter korlensis TaxID=553636 RepID=A0ABV6RUZ0_9GAMM